VEFARVHAEGRRHDDEAVFRRVLEGDAPALYKDGRRDGFPRDGDYPALAVDDLYPVLIEAAELPAEVPAPVVLTRTVFPIQPAIDDVSKGAAGMRRPAYSASLRISMIAFASSFTKLPIVLVPFDVAFAAAPAAISAKRSGPMPIPPRRVASPQEA
jgi:hypothetical protein